MARLNKELEKLQKQHDQIANKLANEGFVAKAPANVVEAERAKLSELAEQIGKIQRSAEKSNHYNQKKQIDYL